MSESVRFCGDSLEDARSALRMAAASRSVTGSAATGTAGGPSAGVFATSGASGHTRRVRQAQSGGHSIGWTSSIGIDRESGEVLVHGAGDAGGIEPGVGEHVATAPVLDEPVGKPEL